ncbi:MAG: lipoyl(octanoyl) transferase LipB [Actinobacteria bacterium]|nr:lipoyl(octanoyl) transferase LipB [Actinomycetota bacterium]
MMIPVLDLGVCPYEPVQRLQATLRDAVGDRAIPGVLLLLEHTPVITLGSRGSDADLICGGGLSGQDIPVLRSERGGAATLHAPGQLVCYPVVPLPRQDLRAFVAGLEATLIDLLAPLGVAAQRKPGAPGLYVSDRKIASVGLRCRRWVASHGTSLNVTVDLGLFDRIVSCGEAGLAQTSVLAETGEAPPMDELKSGYVRAFERVFPFRAGRLERSDHREVLERLGVNTMEPDRSRS